MTGPNLSEALQRKLDTLPEGPGVYLWKDAAGEVLYVGKAKRLKSRVRSYFATDFDLSPQRHLLQRLIADVETIVVPSEPQSLILENNLIKEYRPRFNIRLKDDKSYPSIAVTLADPFPRVLVTRKRDIPGARYFGPYTDVAQLRRTLAIIRRLYTVRSCADDIPNETRDRPCLDYHIGRCLAPCVGLAVRRRLSPDGAGCPRFSRGEDPGRSGGGPRGDARGQRQGDFERARELRDALRWLDRLDEAPSVEVMGTGDADVVGFRPGRQRCGRRPVPGAGWPRRRPGASLSRGSRGGRGLRGAECVPGPLLRPGRGSGPPPGDSVPPAEWDTLRELLPETDWHIPQRGTASRWLELADQNARHLLESLRIESFETEERAEDPVYALGRDLGLNAVPRSFVCVDISHNQGRDTVGSLVWFEAGRPRKSDIESSGSRGRASRTISPRSHEVITRYLTRRRDEGLPVPDLFVIDGGKGQLSAALEAAAALGFTDIPMVSLAKREEEVFLPGRAESLRLPRRSPSLRLLQRARDEAHRFGLAYNRNRRTRRTITSELLNIPGIGPNRAATPARAIREPRRRALRFGGRARYRAGILHPTRRTNSLPLERAVVTGRSRDHA